MRRWKRVLVLAPLAALLLAGCTTVSKMDSMSGPLSAHFSVKIEVLDGSSTPIAPVAWAVFAGDNPLFKLNTATRIKGLEALAEDGDPSGVARALSGSMGVVASGVANTPGGSAIPGPALPGKAYSFSFTAKEGQKLTFATMYVQSNDLFFSPEEQGIDLFPGGKAVSGDITMHVSLYDDGTEKNEQPGAGPAWFGPQAQGFFT